MRIGMLVAIGSLVRRTSEPITLLRTTKAFSEGIALRNVLAAAVLAAIASSAMAQTRQEVQWWNPANRDSFVSRIAKDGITPTGFLDERAGIPLTVISSSAVLRQTIALGGWQKAKAPDAMRAEQALKYLDSKRGAKDWDISCGVLRAQLLAEIRGPLAQRLNREVKLPEAVKDPGFGLSLLLLRSIARSQSKTVDSLFTHELENAWKNWHPKQEDDALVQTLISFFISPFGSPKKSILDAAKEFQDPRVMEFVMSRLQVRYASNTRLNPNSNEEKHRLPALKTPSLSQLIQVFFPFAEKHKSRYGTAGVAYMLAMEAKLHDKAIIYGERFLAMAPENHIYRPVIKASVEKLKRNPG